MPATTTAKTLLTSQALAAGATVNATEWDQSTAYGGRLFVRITNGAAAPTTAPVVKFYSGEASGVKRLLFQATGDTVNNSITDLNCYLEMADMFINCAIINGVTNGVTVEVYGQEATGI
jgi:hypothetical protein